MIDYIPLMLINMAAGLLLLAVYLVRDLNSENCRIYCPGFAATGLVGLLTGLHMCLTWPLPGPYNVAFGEMTVLLSVLFLGASLATGKGWGLWGLSIYAVLAGAAAIVVGTRIIDLGLTAAPLLAGAGFILTGAGGVMASAAFYLRKKRALGFLAAALLVAGAGIWLLTAYLAYWGHLSSFNKPKAVAPAAATAPASQPKS